MARESLAKRCVIAETHDITINTEDIHKHFQGVQKFSLIRPQPSSTGERNDRWILLFSDENEARSVAEKKRKEVEKNVYIMLHSCSSKSEIPDEWLEGLSGDDDRDGNKPPDYDDIFPGDKISPVSPLQYPGTQPGIAQQQHAGPSREHLNRPPFSEHPGGPMPMYPGHYPYPYGASNFPQPSDHNAPQAGTREPDLKRPSGEITNPPPPVSEKMSKIDPTQNPGYPMVDPNFHPGYPYVDPNQFPGYPYPWHGYNPAIHGQVPYPHPWYPSNQDPMTQYFTKDQQYSGPTMVQPNISPVQPQESSQKNPADMSASSNCEPTVGSDPGSGASTPAHDLGSSRGSVTSTPAGDLNSSRSSMPLTAEEGEQDREGEEEQTDDKPEPEVNQPIKMIKVTKIPQNASEDTVRFFFENKRKSGGGDIEDLDYNPETHTAIITFEEEDVAERVLNRMPLLLQDKAIDVELYIPDIPGQDPEEPLTDEISTEGAYGLVIEVRGMKPTTSQDTIMYYFESRKGANADVEKIIYKEENNVYLVWFEEESAIETVLGKTHRIDGKALDVRRYIPPPPPKPLPTYDNKVFITNISPSTTKDGLENFLEAKAKAIPEEVIFGEEEGTALVTFEEPPDIEKLKQACMKRPLDKKHLEIHSVPITDCVVITGLPETISSETLEYYFDNKRRSGVEGVRDVKLEDGRFLVYFDDPQSALDVCERSHTVEGKTLDVQVYYPSLGQAVSGDGPTFKPLSPVQMKDINPRKMEFLLSSKTNQTALEKQLSRHFAEIEWPDNNSGVLEIRCVLTEDVTDWRTIAKTWAQSVIHNVETFLDMLAVEEMEVLHDAWDDVMTRVRDINIKNPESVALRALRDDCKLAIYGHKLPVDELTKKIENIMEDVTVELDKKKQQVTEEVTLKFFQILILLYMHFIDTLKQKFEGLQVHPQLKQLKMVFTGMSGQVTAAKMVMFEQLSKVVPVKAGKYSDGFLSFLKTPEVKNYVVQEMKNQHIMGVWENQDNELMMYSLSDENAVKAVNVLKASILEVTIPLDDKQSALLSRPEWKEEVRLVEEEFSKAFLQINDSNPTTVVLYLTSMADAGIVKEKVNDIFYKHAIQDVSIPLSSGESRLLQEQYETEFKMLEENLSLKHVDMKIDNIRITIRGNVDGMNYAKTEIDRLIKSIHKRTHTITKAGIVKYIAGDQGKSKINQVEKKNKVVIEVEGKRNEDEDETMATSPIDKSWKETATCTTSSGQTITTVVGDITELTVDVIVNAANKELKHIGGLAKVIVDKGGNGIQSECDEYVSKRNRSRMYEGEVFCSRAGKLRCKMIAHAVGPVWQGGRANEDEYLTECIQASLEKCDEYKHHSIAIPALSTGVFGYPVPKATKTIVEAIKIYLKENDRNTTVQKIYLCDLNPDTVEHFVSGLEKYFGKADVQKERGRSSHLSNPGKRSRQSPAHTHHTPGPLAAPSSPRSHITVTLIKGQIASQEVDVIVNTTSTSLQLNQGAVSQSLLKLGGPSLQAECSQKYPAGIQPGEVATTSGGKLECKMLCHGALPGWNPATATKVMETFMKNCLQTADDNGFVSIAFPALGTGNLGYPKQQVAKVMFSCIDRFGSSYPQSSVCDVRFVVYDKDFQTIKAFEEEQRKRQSGEYTDRTSRRLESEDRTGGTSGWTHEAMGGNKQASVDIGNLTLKIYQGDITEAEVDVIVNGTNRELDLSRGGVSQAILKKGGSELSKILQLPATKKQMKNEGITITPATSNFNCDFIVHVDMEDTRIDLKQKFRDILEAVIDCSKETVALPALGAGISYSMDKVAENLTQALIGFQKKNEDVTEVHVIIFDDRKLTEFMVAMETCLKNFSSDGIFSKIKGFLGYGKTSNAAVGSHWKVTKMQKSTLNLVIYAKEKENAQKAIKALEEGMKDDFREKMVEDPVLKELTKDQKDKLMKIGDDCDVEIELKDRLGRVFIRGIMENISDAVDEVHKITKLVDRQKQKQQHAKLVADMVQWYFISVEDTGQKLEEYPPEVNLILEQALKNNDSQAFFLDNSGNKYIVDFNTYQEFPEDDPNDTVSVLRKSKLTDSGFDMPSTWAPMDKTENIKIVPLQTADKEYSDVVTQFQTNMSGNYNSIVKIEKIQNRTLQQQYVAKKKHMESTNMTGTQNERILWHGTAIDAVDSINTYGFNRSYCGKNAVAYGNGVYFAVNPSYSAQSQYARPDPNGNKRMYMCKVLVGEFTKGQGGMKVPPAKPGAAGGHILYDSVVDNPATPGIFVIFHDTQAYPEYLIVFK